MRSLDEDLVEAGMKAGAWRRWPGRATPRVAQAEEGRPQAPFAACDGQTPADDAARADKAESKVDTSGVTPATPRSRRLGPPSDTH